MDKLNITTLFIYAMSIIGVLIGVIWYFVRAEISEIKSSIRDLIKTEAKIKDSYMSKEECRRIMELKNDKNCW